jgi:ribosomal protein S27AE
MNLTFTHLHGARLQCAHCEAVLAARDVEIVERLPSDDHAVRALNLRCPLCGSGTRARNASRERSSAWPNPRSAHESERDSGPVCDGFARGRSDRATLAPMIGSAG